MVADSVVDLKVKILVSSDRSHAISRLVLTSALEALRPPSGQDLIVEKVDLDESDSFLKRIGANRIIMESKHINLDVLGNHRNLFFPKN